MAKKTIGRWGRKGLALLLITTLVCGMLQTNALATNEDPSAPNADEMVYEPAINDGDIALVKNYEDTYYLQDGSESTEENWEIHLSKTAAVTEIENVFDITLLVETKDTSIELSAPTHGAVTLVLDVSNSMEEELSGCAVCGESENHGNHQGKSGDFCPDGSGNQYEKSKMGGKKCKHCGKSSKDHVGVEAVCEYVSQGSHIDVLKEAVNSFLDSFVADAKPGEKRLVSIVEFYTNASTVQNWIDLNQGNNLAAVKAAVNGLSTNHYSGSSDMGGTNMEAGLVLGRNLLNNTVALADVPVANQSLILFSDGNPTAAVGNVNSTSTSSVSYDGEDRGFNEDRADKDDLEAILRAVSAKKLAVAYNVDAALLNSVFGSENVISSTSNTLAVNLAAQAGNVITTATNAGGITDPLGYQISVYDSLPVSGTVTANGIFWNLSECTPVISDGVTTYTITYQVQLDPAGLDEDPQLPGYTVFTPANGATVLSYTVGDDSVPKTADFNEPEVRGSMVYPVTYAYVGTVPVNAPEVPASANYSAGESVAVADVPALEGWTFSGWSSEDADVTAGSFEMPGKEVLIVGSWEEILPDTGSLKITKNTIGNVTPEDAEFSVTGPNGYSKTVKYSEFNDGSYTISNLVLGSYTVIESGASIEGYDLDVTGSNTAEITKDAVVEIVLTNNYTAHTGSLKITKNSNLDVPAEATFTITGAETGHTVSAVYSQFVDGAYTFENLPLDTYTVEETNAGKINYTLEVSGEKTAAVTKGGVAEIALTNTYTVIEPDKGSLTITKTISGLDRAAEAALKETLSFTITGTNYSETVKRSDFNNGDSHTIGNLVVGTYTVTENHADIDGYSLEVTSEGTTASVTKGGDAAVSFINSYTKQAGYLTITKTIQGLPENTDIPGTTRFDIVNFRATIGSNPIVKSIYWSEFENGSVTVELPVGEYTVVEDLGTAKIDGYDITRVAKYANNEYAVVSVGGTAVVEYTNIYRETYVPKSDLSIEKEADKTVASAGDSIVYTITITNAGDAPALVTVVDTPDRNLTVSTNRISDDGIYDAETGTVTWKLYMPKESVKVVTVEATVKNTDAASVTNTVTVSENDEEKDWDTETVALSGSLTIVKTISGLDQKTEAELKKVLSFTVTGPDGFSETIPYGRNMTLKDLEPGVYTIVENNADVGGGYDLTVTARDLDAEAEGYQVEVDESGAIAAFYITNRYQGRTYNIWFDGGQHGSVADGLKRNRWLEFDLDEDGDGENDYSWSYRLLNTGDSVYELDNDGSTTIYHNLAEDHSVAKVFEDAGNTRGLVLYTLTWAEWVDFSREMKIVKPSLSVDSGWVSDREFYLNGGADAFESLAKSIEYLNSDVVEPDVNGIYNAYYVARYTQPGSDPVIEEPEEDPEEEPIISDLPDEEVPLVELPEEETPLVELPDEEVPLAVVPKTGDSTLSYMILAAISAAGLIYLALTGRKREEV